MAEVAPEVSIVEEMVKNSEDNHCMIFKCSSGGELDRRSGQMDTQMDERNPSEVSAFRSAENKKVHENHDPLNNWGYKPGEPDYTLKGNGNAVSQVHENGDGDLPSFSIKRLRRLPHRVSPDNQPSTLALRCELIESVVDQNRVHDEKEIKRGVGENVTDALSGGRIEAGSNCPPPLQAEATVHQRQNLSDPDIVDTGHCSGDSVSLSQQISKLANITSTRDDVGDAQEGSPNVLKQGTSPIFPPGVLNGEIRDNEPVKVGNEGTEPQNPSSSGSDSAEKPLDPNFPDGVVANQLSSETKGQTGSILDREMAAVNGDGSAASEHASDSSNLSRGDDGRWLSTSPSAVPSSVLEPPARRLQVDDTVQGNEAPGNSDMASSSAGQGSVSEMASSGNASAVTPTEDLKPDALTENDGIIRDVVISVASTELPEAPSSGIVQILAPVTGSRFGSPGETTDEETDSPRSSEGFSYPDSDMMALPYSGQNMYPARYSYAQSQNGPSILQYAGSVSLRSDSSTTSNRSFAFPILAPPDYNSSPVRMAKPDPRYLRRKSRWGSCCFFSLCRSGSKY